MPLLLHPECKDVKIYNNFYHATASTQTSFLSNRATGRNFSRLKVVKCCRRESKDKCKTLVPITIFDPQYQTFRKCFNTILQLILIFRYHMQSRLMCIDPTIFH